MQTNFPYSKDKPKGPYVRILENDIEGITYWRMGKLTGHGDPFFTEAIDSTGKPNLYLNRDLQEIKPTELARFEAFFTSERMEALKMTSTGHKTSRGNGNIALNGKVVSKAIKTASGRPSVDSGDAVAVLLRGLGLNETYLKVSSMLTIAGIPGVDEDSLRSRYNHLNVGLQRMSLGNLLRGSLK